MGGRVVEIVIVFFHILAMIALSIGQAKQTLLQNRILAVPHGDRKAQQLAVVTQSGEAVLAPVIGARSCLVVGEMAPRIAVRAVILTHRTPLALAEIRPPLSP
jgi:hypothetical protein